MGTGSHITRRTLGTDAQALSLGHGGRRLIRCTESTRFATDEALLGAGVYFVVEGGQTLVLDPPNFFNELVWIQLDSASSGVVEVWSMGVN